MFGGNGTNTAEVYRNFIWTQLPNMKKHRKGLSIAPYKYEIYIADERDPDIEVFDIKTLTYTLFKYSGLRLSQKLMVSHPPCVYLFESMFHVAKKTPSMRSTKLNLFNGTKKIIDNNTINVHWNSFVPVIFGDAVYTVENGLVWRHIIEIALSKKVVSFELE